MVASAGLTACRSSMKSPNWLSSPSPIGESSDTTVWAIRRALRDDRERQVGAVGQLPGCGLASQIPRQGLRGAVQLVQRLDHVDRDPDCSGLVGNGPGDRLADPPCGVRGKLEAPTIVELVDRPHQPDVPLLDEVQERQPAVRVLLGHRHDQPQIGLGQLLPRLVGLHRASRDCFLEPTELVGGFTHFLAALVECTARIAQALDLAPAPVGPSATRRCLLEEPVHSALRASEHGSRGIDSRDEALSNMWRETDRAHGAREIHSCAKDPPCGADRHPTMTLAHRGRPGLPLRQLLQRRLDGIHGAQETPGAIGQLPLRQIDFGQHDQLAELALTFSQLLAQMHDLARNDQTPRQNGHHPVLATFDPLGDGHLSFTSEEWYSAHLAEIRANQILALINLFTDRVDLCFPGHARRGAARCPGLRLVRRPFDLNTLTFNFL